MQITTQDYSHDREIKKTIGVVMGNTVRSSHFGSDIVANLKSIVGGEVGSYTQLLIQVCEDALKQLIKAAEEKEADGVVALRFTTSSIQQGMLEVLAFSTAVKLK